MLQKTLLLTLLVFLLSIGFLIATMMHQRRTLSWVAVPMKISSTEIHSAWDRRNNRIWSATVNYSFRGESYSRRMHDFPFGSTEIYVNPVDPEQVVAEQGVTIQVVFVPLLATIFSGLFALVLTLIRFSPSDD